MRRDMAARTRAINSLTLRSRHDVDAATAEDARTEGGISQNDYIEIPFIETRHGEEGAQLQASRCRMAALQTDVQAANQALQNSYIFDLWNGIQELHLNLAVRRREGSQRRTLLQFGMLVRFLFYCLLAHFLRGCSFFTNHRFQSNLTG
jgi:hypothetical protein